MARGERPEARLALALAALLLNNVSTASAAFLVPSGSSQSRLEVRASTLGNPFRTADNESVDAISTSPPPKEIDASVWNPNPDPYPFTEFPYIWGYARGIASYGDGNAPYLDPSRELQGVNITNRELLGDAIKLLNEAGKATAPNSIVRDSCYLYALEDRNPDTFVRRYKVLAQGLETTPSGNVVVPPGNQHDCFMEFVPSTFFK